MVLCGRCGTCGQVGGSEQEKSYYYNRCVEVRLTSGDGKDPSGDIRDITSGDGKDTSGDTRDIADAAGDSVSRSDNSAGCIIPLPDSSYISDLPLIGLSPEFACNW